jgi:exopolysaccharide biosynthesis polyprenyl glycosylphosphotransferase
MKRSQLVFGIVHLPIDILMILLAFALAYYIRSRSEFIYIWPLADYLKFILYFLPLWIIVFALEGLYNIRNPKRGIGEFYSVVMAVSTGIAMMVIWLFLSRTTFFSRLVIAYSWFLLIVLVFLGRWILRMIQIYLYKNKIGVQKVLIIGDNRMCYDLIKSIQKDKSLGYDLVGIATTSEQRYKLNKNNIKILGNIENIASIYKQNNFDVLILTEPNISLEKINNVIDFAQHKKISFKEVPNLYEVKKSNAIYSTIGGIPIINFRPTPLEGWGSVLKRIFDIIVSICLIVIFSPIFIITAIAIKIDSPGPVLFVYKRIGRYGKPFTYFKFRSMIKDAHKLRYDPKFRSKIQDLRGWNSENPMIKYKDDPRITRVGKFIRKYSIDELPEFFLVFLGRMSMVGPRPHEKEEVSKYKKHHTKVLEIKPGITGMAQVSGRSDLTFDDEVRLDTFYIENWSIWKDIKILFKTPLAVLHKRKTL